MAPAVLREIHRVLQPGGKWLIVPTAFPIWLNALRRTSAPLAFPPSFEKELERRMTDAGFRFRAEYLHQQKNVVVLWVAEKLD
jgi:ubiquinone/menaquinone biosynthesis C-methylase UbiE